MTPPVGPTGLPIECDGSEPPKWHLALSGGGSDTTIDFDEDGEVDLRQVTSFATVAYQLSTRWSLTGGLGAIWDGSAGDEDLGAGFGLSVGGSYLWLFETERRPFVQLSLSLAGSSVDAGYRLTAIDGRAGVLVGKTFFERLTLFAAARAFAGPVLWTLLGESVMGGDEHHYSVGAGAILRLPGNVDVFAEAMPLGERSFSVGAGVSF